MKVGHREDGGLEGERMGRMDLVSGSRGRRGADSDGGFGKTSG